MARLQLITIRRDTAANWSSTNPVLANGEPGWDTTNGRLKIGDGSTAWNSLAFVDVRIASGIAFTPAGSLAAVDVQGALVELDGDVQGHLSDTTDAHDASAISYAGNTGLSSTDVEAALDELDNEKAATSHTHTLTLPITITIDGGGSAIATGAKKVYYTAPYTGTIVKNRVVADQSGSIVLDIWKDTYANFPPTVADTITASAKPTISAATKSEDATLTGWTTAITAGDVIEVNVDSCSAITRAVLTLYVEVDV